VASAAITACDLPAGPTGFSTTVLGSCLDGVCRPRCGSDKECDEYERAELVGATRCQVESDGFGLCMPDR